MDTRVEGLKQVAQSGDIGAFYALIPQDVKLLEHINELPFADTPLHIAASAGQILFAVEMMGLKPSFARKLDPNGFSPIHLALQNGHIELVRRLLQLDGDLVRVKGKEQLTSLHYIAKSGEHLYLLDEFLLVCPNSIIDVTVQNETALHIALKNDKLEAFKIFMRWLAKNSSENAEFNKSIVLNKKDNEGNTVLHIAVSKNQTEAVRYLLWCEEFVDVNQKNLEDRTAWDNLREANREIKNMLRRANPEDQRLSPVIRFKRVRREIRKLKVEWRNMLLVVAALLVTLSFQAVLTPPGGVWQDNGLCITIEPPFNKTVGSSNHPKITYLSQSNTTLACEHKAGTAVALQDRLFSLFLVCNTAIFSFSNSLIAILILNLYIKGLFVMLNIFLCLSYIYSVWTITDDRSATITVAFGVFLYFGLVQLLSW